MTKLRFAPSPTGHLHLGNTRTAFMNWLFARAHQGKFVLRMDDTDKERSEEKYAHQIQEDLQWLGLTYDEVVRQSDRLLKYEQAAESLKKKGRLYACYETPEELDLQRKVQLSAGKPPLYNRAALSLSSAQREAYIKEGRKPHWRFKMEPKEIRWTDLIRGEVVFQGGLLNDPILMREDGSPVFTLATSVDDWEMGITHVLRGEDHVTNTAIQIQIMEALAEKIPSVQFGHLALISGEKGEGLSKREGSLSLIELRKQGLDPLAILCVLAKLGTSDPIVPHLTLEAIIKDFKIHVFARSSPRLSSTELWQMNEQILHLMSFEQANARLAEIGLERINPDFWALIQRNIKTFHEVKDWETICYGHTSFPTDANGMLEVAAHFLPPEPWEGSTFKTWIGHVKDETGLKGAELFMPLRHALTGRTHGPELKDLILIMGRDTVLNRLQTARR